MNTPKENSHTDKTKSKRYTYAQRESDDFTCIKLLEGKYKDIIYHYGKVGFAKEEKPDGTLPMKFDYTVVRNPNNVDIDDGTFIDYIGDILIELLEEQVNNGTAIQN
tara:strand:+ start:325 stop:645 length:321 start_codon:yes stop_codon:yes gene_type:complete